MRLLVACVGNIFLGDDGFGVEVAGALSGRSFPEGVEVIDFGIRGVHLAYQLLDGYDVLVIVDAAPRGLDPGTVSLVEVDQSQFGDPSHAVGDGQAALVDAHGLEPVAILATLGSLGGKVGEVLVVACEPETVEEGLGLSRVVQAAIPDAVAMVEQVIASYAGMLAENDTVKEVSR